MTNLLFPQFLADRQQYHAAETYWKDLFADVLHQLDQTESWTSPWFDNPDRDGNPIFTATCAERGLAVRILQFERTEPDELDLDWWNDTVPDDEGSLQQLVISCAPSVQNKKSVQQLLHQWVTTATVPENQ